MYIWKGIISWLDSIKAGIRASMAYKELNSLTDRELSDIGLTRSDIPYAVYNSMRKSKMLPSKAW
jgi:uncharacterized protein YjiS (DUF1127 family)